MLLLRRLCSPIVFDAALLATDSGSSSFSMSIVVVLVASSNSGNVTVVDETITSSSFTVTRWSDNILETISDRLALVIASEDE